MPSDLQSILQSATKVNLRGGVVGKVSVVLLCAVLGLAALGCAVHTQTLAILIVVVIFLLVGPGCWLLIRFADKNPQAALLEGAEFITHAQLIHSQKGHDAVLISVGDSIEENSRELTDPLEKARALEPDPTAKPQLSERKG